MHLLLPVILTLSLFVGCSSLGAVPESYLTQIDRTVRFSELKQSPGSYRGRTVLEGGRVVATTPLKDGTWIEVLQLPLDRWDIPQIDTTQSGGRFLAMKEDFIDPAVLHPGMWITIVGEITGMTTRPIGEVDYTYLIIKIQFLKAWEPLGGQTSTFFGNAFWRGAGYSTAPIGVGPSLTIPASPSK
jgi:outer membrane lipoprotein